MTDELIFERIKILIQKEYCDKIEITPTSKLIDYLGMDSLDLVELWLIIEEEFKLDIPDEEARKIETVQDCVNMVKKHLHENISNQP